MHAIGMELLYTYPLHLLLQCLCIPSLSFLRSNLPKDIALANTSQYVALPTPRHRSTSYQRMWHGVVWKINAKVVQKLKNPNKIKNFRTYVKIQ